MITETLQKSNENPLYNPRYQQRLRELHQAKKQTSERLPLKGRGYQNYKDAQKRHKKALAEQKKALAANEYEGNPHAVTMTDLKQETDDMRRLLDSVTSIERVKVQGKLIPLVEFAQKQAFALSQCSEKVIYLHYSKQNKFKFKGTCRCGRRTCSVCAHFDSISERKMLMTGISEKLSEMDPAQLLGGRMVHIVLTHENVQLNRAFDIMEVWRSIQKQKAKKRENMHHVWKVLDWGLWRWELTRNPDTGFYHPHLHVLAWTNYWLAAEENGFWNKLVQSWTHACESFGLKAEWKAQHMGAVMWFTNFDTVDPRAVNISQLQDVEAIAEVLSDSSAEMAKYPLKSTDFTKIMRTENGEIDTALANEIAKLFAMMQGRRLKNGWGGFKLRETEPETDELTAELADDDGQADEEEEVFEVIYRWNRKKRTYEMMVHRPWSESRYALLREDLKDFRVRSDAWLYYGLEN